MPNKFLPPLLITTLTQHPLPLLSLGEVLAPNQLAMGQTYEQLDKGQQGRLGPR